MERIFEIVIIEDEEHISRGLSAFIESSDSAFKVAACFSKGKSFIEYLKTSVPDIVISDIRLPDMLGTDILQYIHENNISTKFILISAYENFSYAKAAIEHNAVAYLTKPINTNELVKTLSAVKKELSSHVNYHYNKSLFSSLGTILENYSLGMYTSKDMLLNDIKNKKIPNIESYSLFHVFLENPQLNKIIENWSYEKDMFFRSIKNFISMPEFLENGFYIYYNTNSSNGIEIQCIVSNASDSINEIISTINKNLSFLINAINDTLHVSFNSHILCGYKSILDLADHNMSYLSDSIYAIEMLVDSAVRLMYSYFCEKNQYAYKISVEKLCSLCYMQPSEKLEICLKIIDERLKVRFNIETRVCDCRNVEEIEHILLKLHDLAKSDEPDLIIKAKQYIADNYSTDISITDIANHCYVHPVYLSRFFKTHTGITIHTYLSNLRIEEAKKCLLENKSIEQTAFLCGYKSSKYFSKLFKEYEGVSPSNYRKENTP